MKRNLRQKICGSYCKRSGNVGILGRNKIVTEERAHEVIAAGGNIPEAIVKQREDIFSFDMNALNKVLQLNLFGTLLTTQFFGKSIVQQKSASIVNISLAIATRAITRLLGYSLGKPAIDCYTLWMAFELANRYGDAIRLNAIMSSFFITEQNRTLLTNKDGSYT
jgi:NAD(P)-dependent dehydrogenase (short-subunit alcohol dehydrogenase family)